MISLEGVVIVRVNHSASAAENTGATGRADCAIRPITLQDGKATLQIDILVLRTCSFPYCQPVSSAFLPRLSVHATTRAKGLPTSNLPERNGRNHHTDPCRAPGSGLGIAVVPSPRLPSVPLKTDRVPYHSPASSQKLKIIIRSPSL